MQRTLTALAVALCWCAHAHALDPTKDPFSPRGTRAVIDLPTDQHMRNTGGLGRGGPGTGAGTADDNASRTVRRCVENRRANSRIDTCGSRRRALRICSNNSTFNLFAMNPTVHRRRAAEADTHHHPGGAKSDEHNQIKWGQNR